jgi:PAS domain S-box-containing protein
MSETQENSQPISVLCIDDDVGILDWLELYFDREPDIALQTSSSGTDALHVLKSQHFDAIICDYSMPDVDGLTLLREIRSRGDNTIFITLTGRRLANVAIETLNNGGNYYLQKGGTVISELPKVVDLIRHQVKNRTVPSLPQHAEEKGHAIPVPHHFSNPYKALIENQFAPICCFDRAGRFQYTNRSFNQDIGKNEAGGTGFFFTIPDDERDDLISQLDSLTVDDPHTHIMHHIRSRNGSLKMFLWNYRAITDDTGKVIGYTALGTDLPGIVFLSSLDLHAKEGLKTKPEPLVKSVSSPEHEGTVTVKKKKSAKKKKSTNDYFAELADSVQDVQYPIFAIDRAGKVIAWNKAIVELTGVDAEEIIGKGKHAYAEVLYGDTRPMLIDYIIDPPEDPEFENTLGITREDDSFASDSERVTINGKPMLLWSKGTSIYNAEGSMIAAIQSIIVSADQSGENDNPDEEVYLGGISSIILKITGTGMGGAIAGAIGSAVGGYGVYATNQRLFVVYNPTLDARRNDSIQFGAFILDELFGTNVDTRPRSIEDLEFQKVFEVWRKDITSIELKKPRLLAGSLIVTTAQGETFRVYIDHKKAFTHLDQLLRLFYPAILTSE